MTFLDLHLPRLARCAALLAITVATASAQTDPPDEESTAPTLDELLGITEDQPRDSGAEAADQEHEEELRRRLNETEIGDAFAEAVEKMKVVAAFLDEQFDAGLGTQRLQEDIIRKLDQLIDAAKKMQSKSSQSSSSQQQGSPETPPDPGAQQPKQQQQQQSSGSKNGSEQNPQSAPPGRQDGDINTVLEETRTEWGGLPPRVRDELLQGRSDKYSTLYEQLTREYYRRLAEEGSS